MITSCGIVIINDNKQILGCIPTNKGKDTLIDIPKGHMEYGETPYECAIRETKEETGLDLSQIKLTDCGEFNYLPKKKLHLFKCKYNIDDISKLKCTTYYFDEKKMKYFTEVCGYRWVNIDDIENNFYKNLSPILNEICNK